MQAEDDLSFRNPYTLPARQSARRRSSTRWSAAWVFLLFQAGLGLTIDGIASKISLVRPWLPPFLNEARILNLQVADANVDLAVLRHEHDVSLKVLRRRGDIEIVVVM